MRWFILPLAVLLIAARAFAQNAPSPSPDPRTVVQTINALQAVLALREDFQKRESDWATYSAPLWQTPAKR